MVVPDHTSVPMFPEAVSQTVLCLSKIKRHGPADAKRRSGSQNSFSRKGKFGALLRMVCDSTQGMTAPQEVSPSDADDVERHPCPRCRAEPGSPCRSRSGAVAGTYHTGRFTKVPRLAKLLRVPTPADRGPGRPWRPGTPVPLALALDTPTADIRIGYARCSTLTQELQPQLDALATHGIPRDKVFSEKISTRVRVRPQFEAALELARQIKARAPHCRVIFTVYEMKPRPGRGRTHRARRPPHRPRPHPGDARRTPARDVRPERARPPAVRVLRGDGGDRAGEHPGVDPRRTRRGSPQGQARRPAGRHHRGHAAHRVAAPGERRVGRADPARPDHPTGKRKGRAPSVASIYRALVEHEKQEAYPEAVEQAHADFTNLQQRDRSLA